MCDDDIFEFIVFYCHISFINKRKEIYDTFTLKSFLLLLFISKTFFHLQKENDNYNSHHNHLIFMKIININLKLLKSILIFDRNNGIFFNRVYTLNNYFTTVTLGAKLLSYLSVSRA